MKRLRTNRFCVNKILIGSLTVCMLLGAFSGCGGTGTSDSSSASGPLKELSEVPEYTEEKKMWIGGWNSPPATEAAYTYAEDGGVNMLWNIGSAQHMELAEKHGVELYPLMSSNKVLKSVEEIDAAYKSFENYSSFGGFNYVDEPGRTLFEPLGELAKNHNEKYPEIDFLVNLYPSSFYYQNSDNAAISYEEYVEEFCEEVLTELTDSRRILSFDHYNMQLGSTGGYLMDNWLYTVEVIADYAKKYDADTHAFFLTTQHYNYLAQTYESLKFQANAYMAYGIEGFSHFTYAGGWDNHPVDPGTGAPAGNGALYRAMSELDNELLAWDDIYLAFEWQEVMQITGSDNLEEDSFYVNNCFGNTSLSVESSDLLTNVSATKDTLIGFFEDKAGNPAMMVTNFDFPSAVTGTDTEVPGAPDFNTLGTNYVKIKIEGANKVLIVRDGSLVEEEITDGTINLSLEGAGAAFVIPLRIVG